MSKQDHSTEREKGTSPKSGEWEEKKKPEMG